MNKRVVLGILVAGGLGIGLFSVVERAMRSAGRKVVKVDPVEEEPEKAVELVSSAPKRVEAAPGEARRPMRPAVAEARLPGSALPPVMATVKADVREETTAAPGGLKVDRSVVCLGVKDRNPSGEVTTVKSGAGKVYCWMRVSGGKGKKVRTVWTLDGKKLSASAWLPIGSDLWRTWSTQRIDRGMAGAARVEIQDESGRVLSAKEFRITK